LFTQLFKTEILNNKNLNINLNINAEKIFQLQNFIDFILNFKIEEGLIDINSTKFSWNKYLDFEILDSLLYVNNNNLILDGRLIVNFANDKEFFKFLQTSRNQRPKLKKLELNFIYNFDQQVMDFNNIMINHQISQTVNNFFKKIILKKDNLQNKIYIKKILKQAIAAYVG